MCSELIRNGEHTLTHAPVRVKNMSEWNYTKCTKPFESAEHAKEYMLEHDFAGWILKRAEGFSAVCPAYPAGYYPDGTVVDQVENSLHELAHALPDAVPSCC
jgi:hypothetical protein